MNDSEEKAEVSEDRDETVDAEQQPVANRQPGMPEPPLRYNAEHMQQPNHPQTPNPQRIPNAIPVNAEYAKVRRMVGIAQIMALVSLLIGGVVLSTAALIVAVIAYSRIRNQLTTNPDPTWMAVRRAAVIGIVLSVGALVLNAISIIVFYPMLNDMFNSLNVGQMTGAGGAPGAGSSSTWG